MIYLDDVTKNWETDGVWKIAPAGLGWINEGAYIIVGEGVSIGELASIGEGVSIGEWASIGEGVSIGEWASIGERACIGERARIGEGASIGALSTSVIDLGWADGYRKCIAQIDGVAWIGAGCRWFTLADAIKHWSNKRDRELTACLMQSAIAIAKHKNWKHE